MTVRQIFLSLCICLPISILLLGRLWPALHLLWFAVLPLMLLGIQDMTQTRSAVRRNYPLLGRIRYLLESVRPEIQQYFVETDINGTPIAREFRSLVYQRAKSARDTRPFGTIFDVNRAGYEWVNHSVTPKQAKNTHPRITVGGSNCQQPYRASPLNISAMSYGALSKNAILALNKGALLGQFAHNTGEGSITPHHTKHGGDLIWQIGTGYFGCRDENGRFCSESFAKQANLQQVKMIEIKISQGAKPGHGGILPAAKVTEEISLIRHVPMGKTVISPPAHSAFSNPTELLEFVQLLRELSNGKPVGFKLCIGRKDQFLAICKAMLETGIKPDFITIDGGEGGTGAAPAEMTNSVGTPLRDSLIFVNSALVGANLRDEIRLIASGKIFSAFHILRALALGADMVNSGRGMMLALGCIQARSCNTDQCPTGITTQNPSRMKGLVVKDKAQRVANYHQKTVANLAELIAAAGLEDISELKPIHINRRVQGTEVRNYQQLYPEIDAGCLLDDECRPTDWRDAWDTADALNWN